jgi:hypothetical protein
MRPLGKEEKIHEKDIKGIGFYRRFGFMSIPIVIGKDANMCSSKGRK